MGLAVVDNINNIAVKATITNHEQTADWPIFKFTATRDEVIAHINKFFDLLEKTK